MSTAVAEPVRKVEPPVWLKPGLLISQVPWSEYEDILRIFEGRHLRIWRFDGESLHVHLLKDEAYTASPKSRAFPELNMRCVTDALQQRGTVDDTQLLLNFCEALRKDRGRFV